MQGLVKLLRIIHQLILSDLQIFKIGQTGGFLGRPLEPLLKTGLPLMKTLLKPLAKSVLILLGLTAAVSATYAAIQKKKTFGSGMTTLTNSNWEIDDIMKIIKSLQKFCLLIKGVSETIENKAKERKARFLSMLLGTLAANLLGRMLTCEDVV